jgi:hypothetical protein
MFHNVSCRHDTIYCDVADCAALAVSFVPASNMVAYERRWPPLLALVPTSELAIMLESTDLTSIKQTKQMTLSTKMMMGAGGVAFSAMNVLAAIFCGVMRMYLCDHGWNTTSWRSNAP